MTWQRNGTENQKRRFQKHTHPRAIHKSHPSKFYIAIINTPCQIFEYENFYTPTRNIFARLWTFSNFFYLIVWVDSVFHPRVFRLRQRFHNFLFLFRFRESRIFYHRFRRSVDEQEFGEQFLLQAQVHGLPGQVQVVDQFLNALHVRHLAVFDVTHHAREHGPYHFAQNQDERNVNSDDGTETKTDSTFRERFWMFFTDGNGMTTTSHENDRRKSLYDRIWVDHSCLLNLLKSLEISIDIQHATSIVSV